MAADSDVRGLAGPNCKQRLIDNWSFSASLCLALPFRFFDHRLLLLQRPRDHRHDLGVGQPDVALVVHLAHDRRFERLWQRLLHLYRGA